jgi:hypothetical protein
MLRNLIVLCLSFYSVVSFSAIQILRIEYAPDFHIETGYLSSQSNDTKDARSTTTTLASSNNTIIINNTPINASRNSISNLKAPQPTSPHLPETPSVDAKFVYAIKYNNFSPMKNVPLENSNLKIQVYYNGNPVGFEVVQTDDSKNFTFEKYPDTQFVTMEVLAVENQEQYHAYCKGGMDAEGSHEIIITCKPAA